MIQAKKDIFPWTFCLDITEIKLVIVGNKNITTGSTSYNFVISSSTNYSSEILLSLFTIIHYIMLFFLFAIIQYIIFGISHKFRFQYIIIMGVDKS